MTDNTIFDSVYKTLIKHAPRLVVPLINEGFGRDYAPGEPVELLSSEHETLKGTIVADSVFRVAGRIYHVECQSTEDSAMVIRMIEYDFAIALAEALAAGAPYRMELPSSCVLYLRHSPSTPDVLEMEVALPDGGSFAYGVRVVKAQEYSREDIFSKSLLLLLPFYLMRYEDGLASMAAEGAAADRLVAECAQLRAELEAATLAAGEEVLYEELTELIIRVSDYLTRANEALRRKVRATMGGEVLELMGERAERLAREAKEQGIEQGIEQGANEVIEILRERGVDAAMLDETLAQIQASTSTNE